MAALEVGCKEELVQIGVPVIAWLGYIITFGLKDIKPRSSY
jgi:hypothetical protein